VSLRDDNERHLRAFAAATGEPVGYLLKQVADEQRAGLDATLMWLTSPGARTSRPRDRQHFARTLMLGSVLTQAGLLGLVDCSRCGDLGCNWCGVGL
jgi:hypothetical protein